MQACPTGPAVLWDVRVATPGAGNEGGFHATQTQNSWTPADGSRILLVEYLKAVAVGNEKILTLLLRSRSGIVELSVDTVVLELIRRAIQGNERVIHDDNLHVPSLATETVNAQLRVRLQA